MDKELLVELRARVGAFLCVNGYKEKCIKKFNHTWNHLQSFMDSHQLKAYTPKTGEDFLYEKHGTLEYVKLFKRQKDCVRHIEVLNDMLVSDQIHVKRRKNSEIVFEGEGGRPFNDFITTQLTMKKEGSIKHYKARINYLYQFLKSEARTIHTLDMPLAIQYIAKLDREKSANERDSYVMTARVFFRFLCERRELQDCRTEKWMSLLKIKNVRAQKIPSVYTQEEVESVINAIDRTSPQGKRDYAMILLAARYGLRSSDIVGLRFANLEWEQNRIALFQQKTGKKIVLPLSEEIGNAIIEYIRYVRPNIDVPYIFITNRAPYKTLGINTLGVNVSNYMRAAKIDSTGRKHGTHSLRHSLASNLLKMNESLPVISQILGHKNTNSTMTYLRVDTEQLRQCALDVPFVPSAFYTNLYE